MAIESLYWKEELSRIAKIVRPVCKPKRWSERAVCTVERDVMIGFFIVRRMVELHKVSSRIAKAQLDVFSAPTIKAVNEMNRFSVEENYNWDAERAEQKSVLYVCNQCIHAYLSLVCRSTDRNWSDLLVASDYERSNVIWRIPFSTIIALFEAASTDRPMMVQAVYNPKIGDFTITTD